MMQVTPVDPSIFRAYDIRGVYPENLTAEILYTIGVVFAEKVAEMTQNSRPHIVVGYDGRHSSPELAAALIAGLQEGFVEVTSMGCGPTPMLYFAAQHLAADGALMITGSHNPPSHNGCKMVVAGRPFFAEQITALGKEVARRLTERPVKISADTHLLRQTHQDVSSAYIQALLADLPRKGQLRMVWDPGNGAGGEVIQELVKHLPGEHYVINGAIDGDFPAHHPDPSVAKNMEELQQCVQQGGYDLGVAFDGDGDRLGVVDRHGHIVPMDQLIAWYTQGILEAHPHAKILIDVKVSDQVAAMMQQLGAEPMMWKTGHSHLKAKMPEVGALFAGEMSGHLFFKDRYYGYDDGIYAAVRVIAGLLKGQEPLDAWVKRFPATCDTGEVRIECPGCDRFALMPKLVAWCKSEGLTCLDLDGVRVSTPTGWWLIRPSHTQEALSLRCQAVDKTAFAVQEAQINRALKECGVNIILQR